MSESAAPSSRVTVTDIQMPFWSMVVFMVKWAFASIPAIVILAAVSAAVVTATITAIGVLPIGGGAGGKENPVESRLTDATPTDPSGIRETDKIYLDYPHMLFHRPGCPDVAHIPSPMAYDREAALSSGYKPHTCAAEK